MYQISIESAMDQLKGEIGLKNVEYTLDKLGYNIAKRQTMSLQEI